MKMLSLSAAVLYFIVLIEILELPGEQVVAASNPDNNELMNAVKPYLTCKSNFLLKTYNLSR